MLWGMRRGLPIGSWLGEPFAQAVSWPIAGDRWEDRCGRKLREPLLIVKGPRNAGFMPKVPRRALKQDSRASGFRPQKDRSGRRVESRCVLRASPRLPRP